jgi:predicted metal-binding membrane protein
MADGSSLGVSQRAVLLACASAVTLAAWLWLVRGSVSPWLPAHHHAAADWRSFVALAIMWQAMMVAMMTPAAIDWLLTYAAFAGPRAGAAAVFAGGYFAVWLGYSVVAAVLQTVLAHAGFLEMDGRLPVRIGGAVLMAAGLLYFTPFQRACLSHCRNPLSYFLTRWKNGPPNGFRLGLTHGAYCVGCCWLLMLTGFAVGVMNVLWMVALTLLICAEKLAPRGERIGAAASAGMAVWGFLLLIR